MEKNKHLYIYTLIVFFLCLGVVQVLLNLKGQEISKSTETLWGIIFIILTIFWVYCDAGRSDFEKPFDFGFLVYIFWPVALPWYLVSTRGMEGVLIFLGFIALWIGPWLMGLVAYVYFSP